VAGLEETALISARAYESCAWLPFTSPDSSLGAFPIRNHEPASEGPTPVRLSLGGKSTGYDGEPVTAVTDGLCTRRVLSCPTREE
jgi:hypothetical protein